MNSQKQTRSIAAIPVVLAALLFGAIAAQAGETLVVEVPFEFSMGDKTFPAGEYLVGVDQVSPDTVLIRSADFSNSAILLSRGTAAVRDTAAFLKFNVYGDQRFLSTIQTSKGIAVTVGRGTTERALAKIRGASSVALLPLGAARNAGRS